MSNFPERSNSFQKIDWNQFKKSQLQLKQSLRQSRRLAHYTKRRYSSKDPSLLLFDNDSSLILYISPSLLSQYPHLSLSTNTIKLQTLSDFLLTDDNHLLLEVLTSIRSMLTASFAYLIPILSSNIPTLLLNLLQSTYPDYIIETSAWIISNLLSEDSGKFLITTPLITSLINLASSDHIKITEYALWALANISADSSDLRNTLLHHNYLQTLIKVSESDSNQHHRVLAWSISNITKETEVLNTVDLQACVKIIGRVIKDSDHEALAESLWALVNLTAVPEIVQTVMDANLVYYAVKALASDLNTIRSPALKTIGNVCAATHEHTQYILNFNILDLVFKEGFIQSPIAKDTFWVLSNIAAGTPNQVKKLMTHPIFEWITVSIVHNDLLARIQVSVIFLHLLKTAKQETKQKLWAIDVCSIMALALRDQDADLLKNLLEICEEVLGDYKLEIIEESGLLNVLEKLVRHQNTEISNKVLDILSRVSN